MSLYVPSFAESLEMSRSLGKDSDAPHQWNELVGGWSFLQGGGDILFDTSGYGNDSSKISTTGMDPATDWGTTGQRGIPWALEFNSNNKQVVTPLILERPWSVATWCRLAAGPGVEVLFAQGNLRSAGLMYNHNETTWTIQDGSSTYDFNWDAVDTNWHQVAAVVEVAARQVYLDGAALTPESVVGAVNPGASGFIIGGRAQGTLGWGGDIGAMTAYSRLILPSEIQQLHEDPQAMHRRRIQVFPTAVVAGGNPWYYYANQAAIVG